MFPGGFLFILLSPKCTRRYAIPPQSTQVVLLLHSIQSQQVQTEGIDRSINTCGICTGIIHAWYKHSEHTQVAYTRVYTQGVYTSLVNMGDAQAEYTQVI